MEGQSLSLQVHPLTEYIQEHFGMHYTQDESYYILDATPQGKVYLGLKEGVSSHAVETALRQTDNGRGDFRADTYVQSWPAYKHDHFLIPAGTPHCSGAGTLVLEISATPYIFTFKLWDWNRMGLDGKPRPIHLTHGLSNIDYGRTTRWVEKNLVNRVREISDADGTTEEQTGLHEREFIETRRHWFSHKVNHDTGGTEAGSVHVLNLIEGREALIESPTDAFQPFVLHYAETVVIPAAVGAYTARPYGEAEGKRCATIQASVRH
jgi:mannose-6-phosphate isomerase class I